MTNFSGNDKHPMDCKCPWKMCLCHIHSTWLAFMGLMVLNFGFLYVIHKVVMHFAGSHAHAEAIFFGVTAFIGAAMMIYHRKCSCSCHSSCDK